MLTGSTGTRHRVGTPSLIASTINAVPDEFHVRFRTVLGSRNPKGAAALVSTALSRVLVRSATKNTPFGKFLPAMMTEILPSGWIAPADQMVRLSSVSRIRRGASPPSAATMNAARGLSLSINITSRPLGSHAGRRPYGTIRRMGPPWTSAVKRPPPSDSERKTRRWPSGDQAGCLSSPGELVTWVGSPPSMLCTQMSKFPPLFHA
jgi:hypothetical protein